MICIEIVVLPGKDANILFLDPQTLDVGPSVCVLACVCVWCVFVYACVCACASVSVYKECDKAKKLSAKVW